MGIEETLKKYSWIAPLIQKADRETRSILMKNLRQRKKNFFPEGDFNADIDNLIKCMLCPNMCRFDCGSLAAASTESLSPAYKARIGYYLSVGKIDPTDPANKEFIDLMYKCSNEENCKIWCPFDFSVVSLLETVRDDLSEKGLMPEYLKPRIENLKKTQTIEDYNIYETYKEKGINNIETDGNDEVYYYIGCEMMKFPEVVQANIEILQKAGIKFSTNLEKKMCCSGPMFNIRDLETAKEFAEKNKQLIESTGAKLVVSDCPGCVLALTNRYESIGVKIDVKIIHIVEYITQLFDEGRLSINGDIPEEYKKVTIHDPCLMARNLNDISSIRSILSKIPGIELIEPSNNKELTHCCGWSGTLHWADRSLAIKEAQNRVKELKETGANIFISACPLCELGLKYGLTEDDKAYIKILDLCELLVKIL
ncbi:MAG: (Fe-S)-binding protein [Candidatus Lokiarchaeota archaeon]|nr:(Fe-S)-binding protein [Candidatus Lokiarchaeota archaeon]